MRSRFPLAVILVALLAAAVGQVARPSARGSTTPGKVFILAGDENMLGRGLPLSDGEPPDPRLLLWRQGSWQVADDPLGDPADSHNGVGSGMTFGLRVLADEPSSTVGLIMCATAGADLRWQSRHVKDCVKAVRAAGGNVAGVLFLEGRQEARNKKLAKLWAGKFGSVISTFRSQLGINMPYLIGELGDLQGSSYRWASTVRDQQNEAATRPGVFLVPTLDLPIAADGTDFTVDGYKTLGARFEDAWHQASATWRPPDEVFVLAGQSNMLGRGKPISAGTQNNSPTILIRRGSIWQIGSDPLGPSNDRENAVGPGMTFALQVLHYQPGEVIGLIMCAVGGTSISQWRPTGSLYHNCVAPAETAGAPVAGILFLQGESDSGGSAEAAAWKGRFEEMLAGFRNDLGPDVPFVLGQIGHIEDAGYRFAPEVRAAQADAAAENPGVALVTTSDLPMNGVHFTVDSYKTIGQRFGDGWWQLAGV